MVQEKDPSLGVLVVMMLSGDPLLRSSMVTSAPAAPAVCQVILWMVPASQVSPPLGDVTKIALISLSVSVAATSTAGMEDSESLTRIVAVPFVPSGSSAASKVTVWNRFQLSLSNTRTFPSTIMISASPSARATVATTTRLPARGRVFIFTRKVLLPPSGIVTASASVTKRRFS